MHNRTWPPDSHLPPVDKDQERAAETFRSTGKAIVEAPPGTGKTFLGIYLAICAHRLGWTSRDYQTLFLTFSRNSRVQIEQELRRFKNEGWICAEEERSIQISNYHAFYFDVLRRKAGLFGCPSPLRPASEKAREQRLRCLLSRATRASAEQLSLFGEPVAPASLPQRSIDENELEQARIVFALRRFKTQDLLRPDSEPLLESGILNALYQDASQSLQEGRPHYDDFAPLFLNLLEWCPELVEWIRLAYPVIILDEFQDTDLIQLDILRRVRPQHLVILYDRYQTIYEWRGVRQDRLEQASQELGFLAQTGVELTQIHRSNGTELSSFIRQLREDELKGAHVDTTTSRPWLTLCPVPSPKHRIHPKNLCLTRLRHTRLIEPGQTTAILTRGNFLAEFLYRNLLAPRRAQDGSKPPSYRCRRIGTGANNLEERLRDLVCDLRGASDDFALRRCLGGLLDLLVSKTCSVPIQFTDEFACDSARLLKTRKKKELKRIRDELVPWWDTLQNDSHQVFSFALRKVLDCGELLLGDSKHLDSDLVWFVRELARSVENLPNGQETNRSVFCDHLEDTIARLTHVRMRQQPSGLYVLTMHQSKGREFDHVIIPWLSAEGEPTEKHRVSIPIDHKSPEDRRLLYVALSRARSHVTIIYPRDAPSPFITEWKLGSA